MTIWVSRAGGTWFASLTERELEVATGKTYGQRADRPMVNRANVRPRFHVGVHASAVVAICRAIVWASGACPDDVPGLGG